MDYKIKDIKLAEQGERQLEWAEAHMPVLMAIRKELSASRPLKGLKVAMLLHVTKETGVLARTVAAAGGEVFLGGSNPLSTQDDVAAALANSGMCVYAWKGQSDSDYERNMRVILDARPDVVMDDGADLHAMVHKEYGKLRIIGGTEETTTGITRLKSMEEEKVLRYPVIAVNNAYTKYLFDNRYGTGQSGVDGVIRATNIMISGKVAAVAGYGWVGRGVAMRLHGLGARVIVTEVNPFRALEAVMDGYEVRKMSEAAKNADLFITATGDKNVITPEHMLSMKDGAIMANVGHFDVEIDVRELAKRAKKTRLIREHLREYTLQNGRRIYLLAEGRLVNLGAAEGHPSEVMDLSFANQALAAVHIAKDGRGLDNKVYEVSRETDERIARLKLGSMGIGIDALTAEQKEYMKQWRYGT
ncbi:MAG: adenosylhomocysteinase [Candidatus Marsarchaeota archaeon]|nr:adenosylhomocysteinase [Candidatus Marsarchaeota archaeon]